MVDFARPAPAPAAELLERLLYAVSHDLRSPALTLSLSGELVEDAVRRTDTTTPSAERLDIGLTGLRDGGRDLERMLSAVTQLSRALRRELTTQALPLAELLEGSPLAAADPALATLTVHVDPAPVRDLLALLAGDAAPLRVELVHSGEDAVLCFVPAIELPPFEDSPLAALCGSLTAYAGTALERVAALQLLFERQGAALHLDAAAAQLWLPLARNAEGAPAAAAEAALAAAIERAR